MTEEDLDSHFVSREEDEPLSRRDAMQLMSTMIKKLHGKVTTVKLKESPTDGLRLSYARALVSVLQVYTSALRDQEIETLSERINRLEGKDSEKEKRVTVYECGE